MKKSYTLIIVIFLSCFLFACNSEDPKVKEDEGSEGNIITFIGTIEEISAQKTGLILVEEGGILQSSDKVWVNLSINPTETFQVGDKVKVGYDGEVKESYPAQIKTLSVERVEEHIK